MVAWLTLAAAAALAQGGSPQPGAPGGLPEPGAAGGRGLALVASKVLTCVWEGPQVIDNGVVLVRDGLIERVAPAGEGVIPEGYEVVDVGDNWLLPGIIELHCHEAGRSLYQVNDLNDAVYLSNPELRASSAVEPKNHSMQMACAAGVTTVLYIPGSATNIGGQGVLVKTAFDRFEENLVKNPGSMKLAQWGNPEAWAMGVGMSFEHWNTRNTLRRGVSYAKRWQAFEEGKGPEPELDYKFEVFRHLLKNEIAISTHTQIYQVVLMTLTMVKGEFNLPVFLDHSEIGGWLTAALAKEMGVPAICGPRSVDTISRGFMNWAHNRHEGVRGLAAGYQEAGHDMIGFNTDSPVVPEEQLPLQAAMGVRYGFDDSALGTVRGLTIVPARAAHIDDILGSLEPGKQADIVVSTGHPADPRSHVERTYVDGRLAYDAERDGRRW